MTNYYCECCDYHAPQHSNYIRHLNTKKHKKSTQSQQKANIQSSKKVTCKYCDKSFTTKQAMYRHMKHSCKKNDDEDLRELVHLLSMQLNEQKIENQTIIKQNKILQQQLNQLIKEASGQ